MSAPGLVFLCVLAMAVVTMFLYLRRSPGHDLTPADVAKAKWFLVAMALWAVVLRGLATEASHVCAVDSRWLSYRAGLSAFWNCSPKLLSGGPAEIFVFFWAWAPFLLVVAFCARQLLRLARRPHLDFKES